MYTEKFTEQNELLDAINPISSSTQVNGSWIDLKKIHRGVAIFNVGLIAATGTLTCQLRQAKTAAGGTPIAFKVATALAAADDDVVIALNFRSEELEDGGYRWVRLEMVAAVAASLISAELFGQVDRYSPASITNYEEVV